MKKYCEKCGAELTGDARFCGNCGAGVTERAQDENGKGWVKATAETPMTHCDKCMRQVSLDGENVCPYCGAEIYEPTGPECPVCGTIMQDGARKCVVCGAEIPGRYEDKPTMNVLSWMVYKRANGLYGISIVGKLILTVLAVAVLGIVWVIMTIAG